MSAIANPIPALLAPAGAGRPVSVLGAEITIRISSDDTGGAFTVFEGLTPPMQGPPLHRHPDQDEWWYILDGDFRFEVDGEELPAHTGDVVFAPRGSVHTFQNVGNTPGRTLTTAVPGGIDTFFVELEKLNPQGAAPDPAKMAPLLKKHRQEILGPPLRAKAQAPATDEQAIRGLLQQYEAAWNRGDSQAATSRFAEDATLIHILGGRLDGRAAIQASYRQIFDTIYKDSSLRIRLQSIRFLRPGVAIVLTLANLRLPDRSQATIESCPTLILDKSSGQWEIVAFHNTRISAPPSA